MAPVVDELPTANRSASMLLSLLKATSRAPSLSLALLLLRLKVYDAIPLLVSHGADIEAQDSDGLRPVHFAAKAGQHIALLALLTAGADPHPLTRRGWNALHYSMAGGHVDATRLLTYWDSDCGSLGIQKNSAGALPMDLCRCGTRRVDFAVLSITGDHS